jgi:bifunctional non-homologous end joining protein LigD
MVQRVRPRLFFKPPMECREVKSIRQLPRGDNWGYELKLDGYRCIAIKQEGEIVLYSRRGLAFNRFLNLHRVLVEQPPKSFILDGEIVALDEDGRSDFNALQNAGSRKSHTHFYAFDLLHVDGDDLKQLPLSERQKRLRSEFRPNEFLHITGALKARLSLIVKKIRQFGFEGVIAKEQRSVYLPGETSGAWVKLKLKPTEEFVVGGFIPGAHGIDQIVVGRYAGKELKYVAATDDGFVPATRRAIYERVKKFSTPRCPFANLPERRTSTHRMDAEKMAKVTWLRPRLVAELAFNEWTPDLHLRHSEFVRIRDDRTIREVPEYPETVK